MFFLFIILMITSVHLIFFVLGVQMFIPGCVAQSVTFLATDASLTADPGVASLIPARFHNFVEIDHEIISTVISSLPLNHLRRVVVSYKGKYVHEVLVNCLFKLAQEKVARWNDCPAMTIAVDLESKATKQTNKCSLIQIKCLESILHLSEQL